jgi:hypothetical protein
MEPGGGAEQGTRRHAEQGSAGAWCKGGGARCRSPVAAHGPWSSAAAQSKEPDGARYRGGGARCRGGGAR